MWFFKKKSIHWDYYLAEILVGLVIALLVLFSGSTFFAHPTAESGDFVTVEKQSGESIKFKVKIADTPEARQKGLQEVTFLESNEGMWFVFDDEAPRNFWMKDTLISLDILYVSAHRKILSIQSDVPPCRELDLEQANCPLYPSVGAAQYVLELPAGTVHEQGIQVGDKVLYFQ